MGIWHRQLPIQYAEQVLSGVCSARDGKSLRDVSITNNCFRETSNTVLYRAIHPVHTRELVSEGYKTGIVRYGEGFASIYFAITASLIRMYDE